MKNSIYQVNHDYLAPHFNSENPQDGKEFKSGDQVEGYLYEGENPTKSSFVVVFGEFIIPLDELTKVHDLDENGNIIPKVAFQEEAQELQKELKELSKNSVVKNIVQKSKNSVNGMLIGGSIGGVISLMSRKNFIWGLIIGATIGGFIGNAIKIKFPKSLQKEK